VGFFASCFSTGALRSFLSFPMAWLGVVGLVFFFPWGGFVAWFFFFLWLFFVFLSFFFFFLEASLSFSQCPAPLLPFSRRRGDERCFSVGCFFCRHLSHTLTVEIVGQPWFFLFSRHRPFPGESESLRPHVDGCSSPHLWPTACSFLSPFSHSPPFFSFIFFLPPNRAGTRLTPPLHPQAASPPPTLSVSPPVVHSPHR